MKLMLMYIYIYIYLAVLTFRVNDILSDKFFALVVQCPAAATASVALRKAKAYRNLVKY